MILEIRYLFTVNINIYCEMNNTTLKGLSKFNWSVMHSLLWIVPWLFSWIPRQVFRTITTDQI